MAGLNVPKIWAGGGDAAFVKTITLTVDDHLAVHYRNGQSLPLFQTLGCTLLIALFISLVVGYDRWQSGDYTRLAIETVAIIGGTAIVTLIGIRPMRLLIRKLWKGHLKSIDAIEIPVEARIDRLGLHQMIRGQTYDCPWEAVHAIEEDGGTIYIWISELSCVPWPPRVFESDEERERFAQCVKEWSGRDIVSPAFLARLGERGRRNLKDPQT